MVPDEPTHPASNVTQRLSTCPLALRLASRTSKRPVSVHPLGVTFMYAPFGEVPVTSYTPTLNGDPNGAPNPTDRDAKFGFRESSCTDTMLFWQIAENDTDEGTARTAVVAGTSPGWPGVYAKKVGWMLHRSTVADLDRPGVDAVIVTLASDGTDRVVNEKLALEAPCGIVASEGDTVNTAGFCDCNRTVMPPSGEGPSSSTEPSPDRPPIPASGSTRMLVISGCGGGGIVRLEGAVIDAG